DGQLGVGDGFDAHDRPVAICSDDADEHTGNQFAASYPVAVNDRRVDDFPVNQIQVRAGQDPKPRAKDGIEADTAVCVPVRVTLNGVILQINRVAEVQELAALRS